jgi:uncharacterized protein (TIGR02117 family)
MPFLPVITLVALWGCAAATPTATPTPIQAPPRHIYVVSHGWHVGIVVQRADIPARLWPEHRQLPAAAYLEIGWGDQDFYQADKVTLGLILKAALLPTPSVLHLVWFDLPVSQYFPASEIVEVGVTQQSFEALCRFIHTVYHRDARGKTVQLGPGVYGTSRFYLAQGKYHLFNTCNTWTAKALRAVGCPISPIGVLTAGSIMARARTFGRVLRGPTARRSSGEKEEARDVCGKRSGSG